MTNRRQGWRGEWAVLKAQISPVGTVHGHNLEIHDSRSPASKAEIRGSAPQQLKTRKKATIAPR